MTIVAVDPGWGLEPPEWLAARSRAVLGSWGELGADGEVYRLRAVNNGQAQVWWTGGDGARYLIACVRDVGGVAVWMLFPDENVWRRVAVVPTASAARYPALACQGGLLTLAWIEEHDAPGAAPMYEFWVVRASEPAAFRSQAPALVLTQTARVDTIEGRTLYGQCKYLSTDGTVMVWTETKFVVSPDPGIPVDEVDIAAMRFEVGGAAAEQLVYFRDVGMDVTLTYVDAGAVGSLTVRGTKRSSDPSVSMSADGRWRVVGWEEVGNLVSGGAFTGTFLMAQVEDVSTGVVYGPSYVRLASGVAVLGGDVSVSITNRGVYLGHQGLGSGKVDGGVWLLSHPIPSGVATMEEPWVPAVGGAEPYPLAGSGGVDHGWLMNVDAWEGSTELVSTVWEWSARGIFVLEDHEARGAVFTPILGALTETLAVSAATYEVQERDLVYQLSATGRIASTEPAFEVPGQVDRGDPWSFRSLQGSAGGLSAGGVVFGWEEKSLPRTGYPDGPGHDPSLMEARLDMFYFEVVKNKKEDEPITVLLFHEAFMRDGTRLPTATVVVP